MGGAFTRHELESVAYPKLKERLPSMDGKVVCITGTTSGTGFVAAKTLAGLGANLVLLNRPSSRSAASLKQLTEEYPQAKIEQVDCDLQNFESVRSAAETVKKLHPEGINVLCNNAGVMALKDEATRDGYDVQMQTNHLSHFVLTKELFPLIKKSAERDGDARIVNHSSVARIGGPLEEKYVGKNGGDLGGNGSSMLFGGARWKRYQQTKLANCLFTYGLKNRFDAANLPIKALVAHPGYAMTALQVTSHNDGGMGGGFMTNLFTRWVAQSEEDGACGILSAMCLPEAANGDFYGPGARGMSGDAVKINPEKALTNPEQIELLWTASEKAVGDFKI